jgi:hypothetical protein
VAGGTAPDLRASQIALNAAAFAAAVKGGNESSGMPKFAELSDRELEALRHYVRYRARLATRPNGIAPPVDLPKPVEATRPDENREPPKPPGSLESTGAPPPT